MTTATTRDHGRGPNPIHGDGDRLEALVMIVVMAEYPTRISLEERVAAGRPDHAGGRLLLALAVVLPPAGTLIGDVVLFQESREHRQGEIGYIFHPDHHGRRYATEATVTVAGSDSSSAWCARRSRTSRRYAIGEVPR